MSFFDSEEKNELEKENNHIKEIGIKMLFEQNSNISVGLFSTSIGILPKSFVYLYRSIAFLEIEKYSKSLQDCLDYLKKYPNSIEGYVVKLETLVLQNEFEKCDILIQDKFKGKFKKSKEDKESILNFTRDFRSKIVENELKKTNSLSISQVALKIQDILKITESNDVSSRSVGTLFLGKFFLIHFLVDYVQKLPEDNSIDVIKNQGLKHIVDSLKINDSELVYFTIKAIGDLCWLSDVEIRWKFVELGCLELLINLLDSDDIDIVGVSITTLSLIGRGGSGIDKVIREKNGIEKLIRLFEKFPLNSPIIPYLIQALNWLTNEVQNKIIVSQSPLVIESLFKLLKSNDISIAKQSAIMTLGNICQNPDIYGKQEHYDLIKHNVEYLVLQGILTYLISYCKPKTKSNEGLELLFNSLILIQQLIQFQCVRDIIAKSGGEKVFQFLLFSEFSSVRELTSKMIKTYKTLQDYGDRFNDVTPKSKRLEIEPPKPVLTNVNIESPDKKKKKKKKKKKSSEKEEIFDEFDEDSDSKDEEIHEIKQIKVEKKKEEKIIKVQDEKNQSPLTKEVKSLEIKDEKLTPYQQFIKNFEEGMNELLMRVEWD